ncbi:modin [Colletotrichum camelliae]|nr:modin [Colletotrichum camelliae]
MSDPLSVISAIVGILAAAGKVVEVLGPYVSAAKDTPKIARSVHSEVVHSRIILSALHGLLDNLSLMPGSRTDIVQLDDLITVFTNGVLIFNELEESVLKISQAGGDRLMARMQWVRKEGDFSAFITRLLTFKATTLLLLNILQCDSDRRATQNYVELSGKLAKLEENTNFFSRLETLEDSFDALSLVGAKRPIQSQSSVSCLSDHQSDMDDRSFYSVETTKPTLQDQKVKPIPTQNESSFAIPTFEFQAALDDSVPYRRARVGTIDFSTKGSVAASNTWSVFSGVSLSEVSVLSRVAIPVYPPDISNSHHYEFMKPTAEKLYTARRPTERTIGQWAQLVKRVPRLKELRFDIEFEVPVIFLCPPTNDKGPIRGADILFIDGSAESLDKTMTTLPSSAWYSTKGKGLRNAIHTSDNELATWVTFLSSLQQMEHESRAWQRVSLEESNHRNNPSSKYLLASRVDINEVILESMDFVTIYISKTLHDYYMVSFD